VANALDGVKNEVRNLTVTGTINNADITFMRDNLPLLSRLDISGVTITSNTMPANSFYNGTVGKTTLTSVKLPTSLTAIGVNAFRGCVGIDTLIIPDMVTSIGEAAFYECTGITDTLVIPDLVTSIGNYAFYKCNQIPSLKLGNAVQSIGNYAFQNCAGITDTLVIPDLVTTIGAFTFVGCNKIPSVKLGNSVQSIGMQAFNSCSGITDTLVIPNSVTAIGSSAFSGCNQIPSVKLGNAVQSISQYAFNSCTGIKDTVVIPNSVTSIGTYAFQNCNQIPSVKLGDAVQSIGEQAFNNCSGITDTLVIPNSVTAIGASAFFGCNKIPSVKLGNAMQVIANSTFSGCSGIIDTLVIPNSVTTIGSNAFYGCNKIPSLKLGNAVQTISSSAFQNCSEITDTLVIPNSVTTIGSNAFSGCNQIPSLKLGNAVKTIGSNAFNNCSEIKDTLVIPRLVTSIGSNAFYNCRRIRGALIIPDSVTTIGNAAFYNCDTLTSLTLGRSVQSIGEQAFRNCSGIKDTLIIPNSVTSIGSNAFQDCKLLTSLTLGGSVETIGIAAFYGCTGLTEIINLRTVPITINNNVFFNVGTSPCRLKVSSASHSRYAVADVWKTYLCPQTTDSISVTVVVNNPWYGWVEGIETRLYLRGDVLTLTGHPMPGFQLMGWTGGGTAIGSNNPLSLTLTQDTIIYVTFGLVATIENCVPDEAGTLRDKLFDMSLNPSAVTHLTVKCNIDARDVLYMRDSLSSLSYLDLSEATIVAYTGAGTNGSRPYPANTMPEYSFYNTVTGGKTSLISVKLPENLTAIGGYAFLNCSGISDTLVIQNSVTAIGNEAFRGCSKLPFVKLSSSLQTISDGAFRSCSGLKGTLIIPDSITYIASRAFQDCSGLSSVRFGRAVQTISSYAFSNCSGLTDTLIIPNSVTSISSDAFNNCNKLSAVILGSSVENIGDRAFAGCNALTGIINLRSIPISINSSVFSVGASPCKLKVSSASHSLYADAPVWTNYLCPVSADSVSVAVVIINPLLGWVSGIEQRLYKIGDALDLVGHPIAGYTLIRWTGGDVEIGTSNTLHLNVTQDTLIYALFGNKLVVESCPGGTAAGVLDTYITSETNPATLTHLTVKCAIDARDVKYMRDNLPKLSELDLSEAIIAAYTGTGGTAGTGNITYHANTMPQNSFYYNNTGKPGLTSVKLPENLIAIGNQAFRGSSGLKNALIIPDSVTSIGEYAFAGCTALPSVNLSKSLKTIGDYAFQNCNTIKTLTIPNTVTSIGLYAFQNCSKLTSLTLGSEVGAIGASAFSGCTVLAEIINLRTVPVIITDDVFAGVNKTTCELKISTDAFPLYVHPQIPVWKDFFNVVDMGKKVIIYSADPQSGSVSGVDSYFYPDGTTLTATGTPAPGLEFISWLSERTVISTNSILTFTLTRDTIISAIFGVKRTVESPSCPGAGLLSTHSALSDAATVNYLTVKCEINAADIKFMRDNMPQLTHLDLSEAHIVAYTGSGGTSATETVYPANVLPPESFANKTRLTSVELPPDLTEIGSGAFNQCINLIGALSPFADITKIIPSGVTKIGDRAFSGCGNFFMELRLPSGVTSIGLEAFIGCNILYGAWHLPDSLKTLGAGAFNGCFRLTGPLLIPSGITVIPDNTFFACSGMSLVSIGSQITSIGVNAFNACTGLTTIINKRPTPQSIGSDVLYGVSRTACRLLVPYEAIPAYTTANVWKEFLNNLGIDGILHVKTDGAGDGITWDRALPGVAEALETARSYGDYASDIVKQIWVAEGIYTPKHIPDSALNANAGYISASSPLDRSFSLVAGVKLYGGFPATSSNGTLFPTRDFHAHRTALSGVLNTGENVYHVLIAAGSMIHGSDTACLDGFTVTGGHAAGTDFITVNGTYIERNNGGGVYSANDTSTYINVVISGNTGVLGGGVHIAGGSPAFINTLVSGNVADNGGGVYISGVDGNPVFTNVTVAGNYSSQSDGSGGIYVADGSGNSGSFRTDFPPF
jgi:hypothetical protein